MVAAGLAAAILLDRGCCANRGIDRLVEDSLFNRILNIKFQNTNPAGMADSTNASNGLNLETKGEKRVARQDCGKGASKSPLPRRAHPCWVPEYDLVRAGQVESKAQNILVSRATDV